MKLGLISDTHDHFGKAEKAAEFFESRVDAVIHCGDVICPATAEIFDRSFDFYCVRGNNDGEWNLKRTIELFGDFYNNVAELEFEDENVAVYHGTEEELVESLVKSGEYDYVFRGHTHLKKVREVEGTLEINPGGVKLPFQDEEIRVVVLNLDSGNFEFHELGV